MTGLELLILAAALYEGYCRSKPKSAPNVPFDELGWEYRQQWILRAKKLHDSHFTQDGLFRMQKGE